MLASRVKNQKKKDPVRLLSDSKMIQQSSAMLLSCPKEFVENIQSRIVRLIITRDLMPTGLASSKCWPPLLHRNKKKKNRVPDLEVWCPEPSFLASIVQDSDLKGPIFAQVLDHKNQERQLDPQGPRRKGGRGDKGGGKMGW